MARMISDAFRRKVSRDVSATDVAKAMSYFRNRFGAWVDGDELVGEALAHWWREYVAERSRDRDHATAARRATYRAAGCVVEGQRFARTVATQYVDQRNPIDWRRRQELDAERDLLSALRPAPVSVCPWRRLRLELCAALGIDQPEFASVQGA